MESTFYLFVYFINPTLTFSLPQPVFLLLFPSSLPSLNPQLNLELVIT